MRTFLLLLAGCALASAAELAAGSYICVYAEVGAPITEIRVTLAQAADGTITLSTTENSKVLRGRRVGDRLYLVFDAVSEQGLEVTQVVALIGPDDYAIGTAFSSLNAEALPKKQFILKRAP